MKFLNKHNCQLLKDNNLMLDITPVADFEDIFLCVSQKDNEIILYDGGSITATLKTLYNFSSQQFLTKLVEICKNYQISKNGNVFFLQCTTQTFDNRLEDFVKALNEICKI